MTTVTRTFIPVLWGAMAVALTAYINEYFATAIWGPVALTVIIAIGQWVAVQFPKVVPAPPAGAMGAPAPEQKKNKVVQWFVG